MLDDFCQLMWMGRLGFVITTIPVVLFILFLTFIECLRQSKGKIK